MTNNKKLTGGNKEKFNYYFRNINQIQLIVNPLEVMKFEDVCTDVILIKFKRKKF
jgi:hypothetical protein